MLENIRKLFRIFESMETSTLIAGIAAFCLLNFIMLFRIMVSNDRARTKLFSLRHFIRRQAPDPLLETNSYYWESETEYYAIPSGIAKPWWAHVVKLLEKVPDGLSEKGLVRFEEYRDEILKSSDITHYKETGRDISFDVALRYLVGIGVYHDPKLRSILERRGYGISSLGTVTRHVLYVSLEEDRKRGTDYTLHRIGLEEFGHLLVQMATGRNGSAQDWPLVAALAPNPYGPDRARSVLAEYLLAGGGHLCTVCGLKPKA